MCDATPLANAAPAAEDLAPLKTVASEDAPSFATTSRAIRAGASIDPASAEPSQSRMARRVSAIVVDGKSSNRVTASTSARRRLTASGAVDEDVVITPGGASPT